MGGPLTPYFLQLAVQNFTEMRNLKKMQKSRKMPKISKFRFFWGRQPQKIEISGFQDFSSIFNVYLHYKAKSGPSGRAKKAERPGKIGFCDFRENFSNFEGSRKPLILDRFGPKSGQNQGFWTPKILHIFCNSR